MFLFEFVQYNFEDKVSKQSFNLILADQSGEEG